MDQTTAAEAAEPAKQAEIEVWQSLIQSARAGCDESLGKIYSRTRSYLLLVANQQVDHGLHAKFGVSDIVQQTQMEAFESLGQFSGESEAEYRSWIKRIVINNLIDESRRYTQTQSRNTRREVSIDLVDGTPDGTQLTASSIVRSRETDQELENAIRKLSPKQQQVVFLKHRFGYNYSEISKHLQVSESAVRTLWSRAIGQLKNLLDNKSD